MRNSKHITTMAVIMLLAVLSCVALFVTPGISPYTQVILITLDAFRADHLSGAGYIRPTSPFLDSLAERSVVFERAYSQCTTTWPSHAAMLTGMYPSALNLIANGHVLDDSYTLLSEILLKRGFTTAAFTNKKIQFPVANLLQGFDVLYDPNPDKGRSKNNILQAMEWLQEFNIRKKHFLWLHFWDCHDIERGLPEDYYRMMDESVSKQDYLTFLEKRDINLEVFDNDPNDMYSYITSYDAEIRTIDDRLRELFEIVQSRRGNHDILWIITGDHGESLGQHYWRTHGKSQYQEAIHVPLIIYSSREDIRPRRIGDVVENFDLFPTVLDLLKIRGRGKFMKSIQAVSLADVLWGKSATPRNYAFTERRHYEKREVSPDIPEYKLGYEEGRSFSVQENRFKLIFNTVLENKFFDIKKDPFELDNISGLKYPDIEKRLEGIIRDHLRFFSSLGLGAPKKVGQEDMERLRTLGYIF